MSSLRPSRPDAMPLREALRGLRHALRRGGESLRDTLPVDQLPRPAQAIAGAMLREVDQFARGVDSVASDIAKKVLGRRAPAADLRAVVADPAAEADFTAAVYAALRSSLRRLGVEDAFVSEAAARRAFRALAASERPRSETELSGTAADLALRLLAARVVRDSTVEAGSPVNEATAPAVSVFAVLLWLLSDRPDHDGEAALAASTDIAVALRSDIAAASADRDRDRLARLFDEFASHV